MAWAYVGETAALTAAGLWAGASVLYVRLGVSLPPLMLNFAKGLVAITLIGCTLLITGASWEIPTQSGGLLVLSGALGIGLGDTAFFSALNALGARRTLLLETSAPLLVALLAWGMLGEILAPLAWSGILLTSLGIAWVIAERTPGQEPLRLKQGLYWAFAAALCQAFGSLFSRAALTSSDISPLLSTGVRLVAGNLAILPLLLWRRPTKLRISRRLGAGVAITAFGGTYLGIWLQQTALKFAPAGVAQTLLATSPLFVLPLAAITGEKVTVRALLGAVIALLGTGLLFIAH
ncbi:MAG: DMT family transporter [Cyanobacteria bacterium P01_H01_bin.15]